MNRALTSRWGRWTLLTLAAMLLGVLLLWMLPALLTRHPSSGMTPAERLKAVNDVRTPLVGFVVLLGSGLTLWFTARTYRLSKDGQVTDRYTKAVSQIGDRSTPIRVGGIYALGRIGDDSPQDRDTVIWVLGALIRERSREEREREDVAPEDVRAALWVVSRLLPQSERKLNVRDADLRNTDLSGFHISRLVYDGAKMPTSKLPQGYRPPSGDQDVAMGATGGSH